MFAGLLWDFLDFNVKFTVFANSKPDSKFFQNMGERISAVAYLPQPALSQCPDTGAAVPRSSSALLSGRALILHRTEVHHSCWTQIYIYIYNDISILNRHEIRQKR
jgi:hypothetical protein